MPTEAIVGLFTLGGVALGFAGQWFMERQRVHRSRVGMVKAMLGELRANAAGANWHSSYRITRMKTSSSSISYFPISRGFPTHPDSDGLKIRWTLESKACLSNG